MNQLGKLKQLISSVRRNSRHFGCSSFFALRRIVYLHNKCLFSIKDIDSQGLVDPTIEDKDLAFYISREARVRLERKFNDRKNSERIADKSSFNIHCAKAGIRHPIDMFQFEIGEVNAYEKFAVLDDGTYLIKPFKGGKGEGIRQLVKQGEHYSVDHGIVDSQDLIEELAGAEHNQRFLVQKKVVQHRALTELSGSEATQTARIVTCRLPGMNTATVLFARFKVVVGKNVTDNFRDGETGNLIGLVDADSGIITTVYCSEANEIGLTTTTHHPDTQVELVGYQIPLWEQTRQMALDAASTLTNTSFIGWDIAITDEGPCIIEANENWGTYPACKASIPLPAYEWLQLIR